MLNKTYMALLIPLVSLVSMDSMRTTSVLKEFLESSRKAIDNSIWREPEPQHTHQTPQEPYSMQSVQMEKYTASSFTDILSAQPITVISEPSSTLWIFTIAMSLSTSSIQKITQQILRQSRTLSTDTIAKLSKAPLQTATYFKSCYLKADYNSERYQTPRPTNAETQR